MSQFDKVIGYEEIKMELIRICDVVKNPEKYARLGVTMPRGIMLWGKPGLGKTLMAKCFIAESGCKAFIIRKDKPNGAFVNVIRDVFEKAKAEGRAIVFLDDMDKFANEDNQHPDAEEYVAVQACIDSCKDSDVFVLATANDKWCLPDSLLRSGRFDKVIELECPKGDNAVKVIQYYLSQKTNLGDADAIEIARIMNGHSCADLETVVNEAGIYAGYDGRDKIGRQDLLRACMRMLYEGPEYVEDKEDWDSKFRAVHEAGHAVASEVLEPGSVSLLSISGYSGECGGFTIVYTPVDYGKSEARMEQYMIHKLAAKAATELVLGLVDVGCRDDISEGFDVARTLVDPLCAYGFDAYEFGSSTEVLRQKKEQLIANEIAKCYRQAKKILIENRMFLDKTIEALLEKKTLTQKDIKEIKDSC